jgi:hypothetical protein
MFSIPRRCCLKPFLMPFIDLPLHLQPIMQVVPMFATALLPQFVCSSGTLFFQAHV